LFENTLNGKLKKKFRRLKMQILFENFTDKFFFSGRKCFWKASSDLAIPSFKFKQVRFNSFAFWGGNVNQLKKLVIVNAGKNYFEFKLDRHTTSE
jgi:hypothetical protein